MHFHRLYVAAFNRFRAPFTVPLDTPGLILVEGENRDWQDAANSNGTRPPRAPRPRPKRGEGQWALGYR